MPLTDFLLVILLKMPLEAILSLENPGTELQYKKFCVSSVLTIWCFSMLSSSCIYMNLPLHFKDICHETKELL